MEDRRLAMLAKGMAVRRSRRRLIRAAGYGAAWLPSAVLVQQAASCGNTSIAITQCPAGLRIGELGELRYDVDGPIHNLFWRLTSDDGRIASFVHLESGRALGDMVSLVSVRGNPIGLRAESPGVVTVTIHGTFDFQVLIFPFTVSLHDSCTIRIPAAEAAGTPEPQVPAPAGPIRFADREFDPANWEVAVDSTGGATEEAIQVGGYRRMVHSLPDVGSLVVRHLSLSAAYDPAREGAIDRIDYAEDRVVFAAPPGVGVGAAALLEQGGTFYRVTVGRGEMVNTEWERARGRGLRAEDFTGPDGTHPDFSTNGAPIRFGYLRSNRNRAGGALTVEHGIDDWVVTVHRAASSAENGSPDALGAD